MSKGRSEGPGMLEIRVEGGSFRETVQVFEGGWVSRDVSFIRRFQEWNLNHTCGKQVRARAGEHGQSARTISKKSAPTRSWPEPPSRIEPSESSSLSVKRSENRARSATLLNMIFASFLVIGGAAFDDPDEFDAMEIALEDEPDEPDEDSALELGLNGDGCPVNRGRRCREHAGSDTPRDGWIAVKRLLTQCERDVNIPY